MKIGVNFTPFYQHLPILRDFITKQLVNHLEVYFGYRWPWFLEHFTDVQQIKKEFDISLSYHLISGVKRVGGTICDFKKNFAKIHEEHLQRARTLEVDYVLVHVPCIQHRKKHYLLQNRCDTKEHLFQRIRENLDWLLKKTEELGIPKVVIENSGYNPWFYTAEDFITLLKEFSPQLGFCYDVGHIYLLNQSNMEKTLQFTKKLSPWIISMHVYQTKDIWHYKTHYKLPLNGYSAKGGFIDYTRLFKVLFSLKKPRYVIHELGIEYHEHLLTVKDSLLTMKRFISQATDTS